MIEDDLGASRRSLGSETLGWVFVIYWKYFRQDWLRGTVRIWDFWGESGESL